MSILNERLPSWPQSRRTIGEVVYNRAERGLDKTVLNAWHACGMNVTAVPQEAMAREREKLHQIATGDLSDSYFQAQAEIIATISNTTDVVGYLSNGYAAYAAGLVNTLLDGGFLFDRRRPELVESLMRSIFTDVAVVVHHFVQAELTEATIKGIGEGLDHLAKGDLTHRVTADLTGKFAKLKTDFNAAMDHLQETVCKVQVSTTQISTGSQEISTAADDLSRRTEQQASSLEETAAALEEITATVKKTAVNAKEASHSVETAKQVAEAGGLVVETAVKAMDAISQSSKQITDIIGVIDEIAFQTNLLALNAGVEAARAGEAGKGFAVVASEVRSLAQRSSEAAKQIRTLIRTSGEQVGEGVKFVGESGNALKRIVEQVLQINALVSEMAQAAEQQSTGIEQVNAAVGQMDQVTQQNAAMVEESTAASRNLAQEANNLSEHMHFFSVGEASHVTSQSQTVAHRAAVPSKRSVSKPSVKVATASGSRHAQAAAPRESQSEPDSDWTEF